MTEFRHQVVEAALGLLVTRTRCKSMRQQPVHGMADGRFLSRSPFGWRRRNHQKAVVEGHLHPLPHLTEEQGGIDRVVRRERIKGEHRRMEEVPGVDRRAGKISADGLQEHLVPLARHGLLDRSGPGQSRRSIDRRLGTLSLGHTQTQPQGKAPRDPTQSVHTCIRYAHRLPCRT